MSNAAGAVADPVAGRGVADTAAAIGREAARRRTFAIISHPDAGKTTLTEKLLLYGGAVDGPAPSTPAATAGRRSPTG